MDKHDDDIRDTIRIRQFYLPEKTGALFSLKKDTENRKELIPFILIDKQAISSDSYIFTFQLPEDMYLGVNICYHLAIHTIIKNGDICLDEEISRKYTPISHIYTLGKFDLIIKIYRQNANPDFPKGGRLSQWLEKVEIGTEVLFRGPIGRMSYYGDGYFKLGEKGQPIRYRYKKYTKIGLICAGTGIAPIYQLLLAAHLNNDTPEYTLIYGNRSYEDILLKSELDEIYLQQKFKFVLYYTLTKPKENWTGLTGRISKEQLLKYLPTPSEDTLIMTCGRARMCKKFLIPLLIELGHNADNVYNI